MNTVQSLLFGKLNTSSAFIPDLILKTMGEGREDAQMNSFWAESKAEDIGQPEQSYSTANWSSVGLGNDKRWHKIERCHELLKQWENTWKYLQSIFFLWQRGKWDLPKPDQEITKGKQFHNDGERAFKLRLCSAFLAPNWKSSSPLEEKKTLRFKAKPRKWWKNV